MSNTDKSLLISLFQRERQKLFQGEGDYGKEGIRPISFDFVQDKQ